VYAQISSQELLGRSFAELGVDRVVAGCVLVDVVADLDDQPVLRREVTLQLETFVEDHLGIDEGLTIAMIENFRSGLIWRVMRRNPYVRRGLERAGFQGGWLDTTG